MKKKIIIYLVLILAVGGGLPLAKRWMANREAFVKVEPEELGPVKYTRVTTFSRNHFPQGSLAKMGIELAGEKMESRLYEPARKIYEAVIRLDPKQASAWNNLGFIAGELGNTKEAMSLFVKAIDADGECAECFHNLGILMLKDNKKDEAKVLFEKAATLGPDYVAPRLMLANLMEDASNWEGAYEWYKQAIPHISDATLNNSVTLRSLWMAEIIHNLRIDKEREIASKNESGFRKN